MTKKWSEIQRKSDLVRASSEFAIELLEFELSIFYCIFYTIYFYICQFYIPLNFAQFTKENVNLKS